MTAVRPATTDAPTDIGVGRAVTSAPGREPVRPRRELPLPYVNRAL
jgi:hypothetical protein